MSILYQICILQVSLFRGWNKISYQISEYNIQKTKNYFFRCKRNDYYLIST